MDKTNKNPKTLYHQVCRECSLNGPERQIFWALVQSEINAPKRTALGLKKALRNLKKRSPVYRAYKEFHRRLSG